MGRPCIFISAVSAELAGARRAVARVLGTLGYDPVSEEDFPAGHGELKAWLTEQIDACEGVIQLVGEAYGAEPPASADPTHPWPDPKLGRCSYTQYELLYAWRQGKHTWVILMEPGYPRDTPGMRPATGSTSLALILTSARRPTPPPTRPSVAPCSALTSSASRPTTTCATAPAARPNSQTCCCGSRTSSKRCVQARDAASGASAGPSPPCSPASWCWAVGAGSPTRG